MEWDVGCGMMYIMLCFGGMVWYGECVLCE